MIEGSGDYGWESRAVCLGERTIEIEKYARLEAASEQLPLGAKDKYLEAGGAVRNCEESCRKQKKLEKMRGEMHAFLKDHTPIADRLRPTWTIQYIHQATYADCAYWLCAATYGYIPAIFGTHTHP